MRVAVVGTGYVGVVTSVCLGHLGHTVCGLDIDAARIERLASGRLPFYEAGVEPLLRDLVGAGVLHFTTRPGEAIPDADVVFLCVGTPGLPDGRVDLTALEAAARCVGQHLGPHYTVIATKSTVPVGSGDWVGELVRAGVRSRAEQLAGVGARSALPAEPQFDVVSNPEFLREGTALRDAMYPDRIVLGGDSPRALQVMKALYDRLARRDFPHLVPDPPRDPVPVLVTDRTSAELLKYAANAFLATKISFINEIAGICERVGADVRQVAAGIGLDPRIGNSFLNAGIGWGGSCFPKDLAALIRIAGDYGQPCVLLESAAAVNRAQRLIVVRKLQERLKTLQGKRIALWGLAFKPGTDDLRDAPSLAIARRLGELGALVSAYDPVAGPAAQAQLPGVAIAPTAEAAATEADAIVVITEWEEFLRADWSRLARVVRRKFVLDGRNCLDPKVLAAHGFEVCGIGW